MIDQTTADLIFGIAVLCFMAFILWLMFKSTE